MEKGGRGWEKTLVRRDGEGKDAGERQWEGTWMIDRGMRKN